MEKSFTFNADASPVTLPEQNAVPPLLKDALLVGWGYPYVNGTVASILQKVDINIYPDGTCLSYFNETYSPVSHICAGGGGKGQCTVSF